MYKGVQAGWSEAGQYGADAGCLPLGFMCTGSRATLRGGALAAGGGVAGELDGPSQGLDVHLGSGRGRGRGRGKKGKRRRGWEGHMHGAAMGVVDIQFLWSWDRERVRKESEREGGGREVYRRANLGVAHVARPRHPPQHLPKEEGEGQRQREG